MGQGLAITGFGHFSVVVGGEDCTRAFSPRSRRALAHLALCELPVERSSLAVQLWPDMDRASALANLRRRLHDLERAFRQIGVTDALDLTRDRVALASAVSWSIDVTQYDLLARDPTKVEAAAALYREPVFPEIEGEMLDRERLRLHGVQTELLTQLLELSIDRGDPQRIERFASAILRLDPLSEQTVAKSVAALDDLGEKDRARRLGDRLRQTVRDELDEEPTPLNAARVTTTQSAAHLLESLVERSGALRGPNASRHFPHIERQMDEIRRALDAAIARGEDIELGVRALAALSRFMFDRGHAAEAARWYAIALRKLPNDSASRGEALYLYALVGRNLGGADHNLPAFDEAIAALRSGTDETTLAKALLYASNAARMTGRASLAQQHAGEALTIVERHDDPYLVAFARSAVAVAAYAVGDLETARAEFERAAREFASLGAGDDETLMLVNAARCALARGAFDSARDALRRALDAAGASGNLYIQGHAAVGLALVAIDASDDANAKRYAARAATIALECADTELSVIAIEASGELFLALGEPARARDALAAADGVRSQYLIARAPTEQARSERLRERLAGRGLRVGAPIATSDVMMRSLLESVARYAGHTL